MKAKIPYQISKTQEKELERLIKKQISESMERFRKNIDAIVLWELHEQFGFGVKRLRMFQERFDASVKELQKHYELNDFDDQEYICSEKLKQIGYDINDGQHMLDIRGSLNGEIMGEKQ